MKRLLGEELGKREFFTKDLPREDEHNRDLLSTENHFNQGSQDKKDEVVSCGSLR